MELKQSIDILEQLSDWLIGANECPSLGDLRRALNVAIKHLENDYCQCNEDTKAEIDGICSNCGKFINNSKFLSIRIAEEKTRNIELRKEYSKIYDNSNKTKKLHNNTYFRVGRKQRRAVLDAMGKTVVVFPKGYEHLAYEYAGFLNWKHNATVVTKDFNLFVRTEQFYYLPYDMVDWSREAVSCDKCGVYYIRGCEKRCTCYENRND